MKDLTWLKHDFIAHRGLHTLDMQVPENSLAAFRKALDSEYAIELDINATKDGVVLAFHDFNLKRLCGVDRNLSEVTYDDIKDLTLSGTQELIPTLKDVLKLVDGHVPLLIEFKPHGDVETLCQSFIRDIDGYKGIFAVFSFHPKVVKWFKKHHPEIIRGQIAEYFKDQASLNFMAKYLLKTMFFNRFTRPDFVSYGIHDMPNKYLDRLMKKGMTVISYAAQSQEALDQVKSRYHNAVFEYFEPKR